MQGALSTGVEGSGTGSPCGRIEEWFRRAEDVTSTEEERTCSVDWRKTGVRTGLLPRWYPRFPLTGRSIDGKGVTIHEPAAEQPSIVGFEPHLPIDVNADQRLFGYTEPVVVRDMEPRSGPVLADRLEMEQARIVPVPMQRFDRPGRPADDELDEGSMPGPWTKSQSRGTAISRAIDSASSGTQSTDATSNARVSAGRAMLACRHPAARTRSESRSMHCASQSETKLSVRW